MLLLAYFRRGRMTRRHRPLFHIVLVLVVVLLLVVHGSAPAAALTGTAPCPATAEAAAEWCIKWFGGAGGTVTAGTWNEAFFSCVCNGAVSLRIDRHLSPIIESGQKWLPSVASPSLAGSSSSLDEFSSSALNNSGSSSSLRPDWASSLRWLLARFSSSMTEGYTCQWTGFFSEYPDGVQCLPSTGVCPTTCTVMPPYLCEGQQAGSCTVGSNGTLLYSCSTCTGRLFTINTTGPDTCNRAYTEELCDPEIDCSGHGCCATDHVESSSSSEAENVCKCFANRSHGFYAGSNCAACASGYYVNSEGVCKTHVQPGQVLLASIATTWTMVSPNLAVLFLFVIFSMVRKLNASDRPFELTGLRRANLSSVHVARRRQQSLFHSKYIPMRPAKSRSFANPNQPRARGPSAY
ncbi:hypothetical protein LPMP_282850 [Leishmania panamensis]|uniref:Uncharacterized protein n=2 Tax=Viannia TaxID=37616 RepID=A0A088RUS7_LEIPA|nr:hypothetical protein LPMP_282850 [Leishmania panamensis]AIN99917.1 hypothetical protein LPMP_282850 [Leishmania panamensis]